MFMSDRLRIRLFGQHLAYISKNLYYKFLRECNILDYSVWIKELAYKEYRIKLKDEDTINLLKGKVVDNDYEDIGDWLREKMRKAMKKARNLKEKQLKENLKNE